MRGVITAFVTLELITMLSWVFAYVYSTTKGGPNFASYVIELYIFDNAFTFRLAELRGRGGDPPARGQHRADRRSRCAAPSIEVNLE